MPSGIDDSVARSAQKNQRRYFYMRLFPKEENFFDLFEKLIDKIEEADCFSWK